jgi:hypothetical protein
MFTNTQNWSAGCRPKVVSILATLFGAGSAIWSTLYTGCMGGHVQRQHHAAVGAAAQQAEEAGLQGPWRRSPVSVVVGWSGGLAISPPSHLHTYDDATLEGSAGGDRGDSGMLAEYRCVGGWVNGDVARFFGTLALVLPVITLVGAWGSFRMDGADERRRDDAKDGGEQAVARRLDHGVKALLTVLLIVGASTVLAVSLDGKAAAIDVHAWAPLLMLCALTALLAILGDGQDFCARFQRRSSGHSFRGSDPELSSAAQPDVKPPPITLCTRREPPYLLPSSG